jgi:hypothetical protein
MADEMSTIEISTIEISLAFTKLICYNPLMTVSGRSTPFFKS